MFTCLIGAAISLLLWSRLHDRQLGLSADVRRVRVPIGA
jgi:hypothetical protein